MGGGGGVAEEETECPKSLPPAKIEFFFNRAHKMLLKEVCALRCPTALQLTWIHVSINLLLELRMQCHACAHSRFLPF
jgi:hypothetical protein